MSRRAGKALFFSLLTGVAAPGYATAVETALPQILPIPGTVPAPAAPAPIPPPINPGYVASPSDGLSPVLSQSVPVYQLPQESYPSYPPPQLPGPIDQQKMQAYSNDLRAQQWQLQSQGLATSSILGREIQRQLNTPDAQ